MEIERKESTKTKNSEEIFSNAWSACKLLDVSTTGFFKLNASKVMAIAITESENVSNLPFVMWKSVTQKNIFVTLISRMIKVNTSLRNVFSRNLFSIYLFPIGLIFLADAILSYIFPIIIEKEVQSQMLMGIIMSFSSVIGIVCDLIFPEILKKWRWPTILFSGAIFSLGFTLFAHFSVFAFPAIFALIAVSFWGIYYELIGFSEERFIVNETSENFYTRSWSIINSVIFMTWIISPIIGAQFLLLGAAMTTGTVIILQGIAILASAILFFRYKNEHDKFKTRERKVNIYRKLSRTFYKWKKIFKPLLPITLSVFAIKIAESAYWMFGALFAETIPYIHKGDEFIIILLYTVPLIFGTFICAYTNIHLNKKLKAEACLFFGGILTILGIYFRTEYSVMVTLLLLGNTVLAFVGPLMSSTSSEIQRSIAKEDRFYIVGLVGFSSSFAYILGPLALGTISEYYSYSTAFMFTAGFIVFTSITLMIFTRK